MLAVCSGLGLLLSFALPVATDHAAERLAYLLLTVALVVATALWWVAPPSVAELRRQCEEADMVAITTLGAFLALCVIPQLPLDDDTAAFLWVVGLSLYWSPAILIPRRLLDAPPRPPLSHI